MRAPLPSALVCALLGVTALFAGAARAATPDENKDIIEQRNGTRVVGYIDTETTEFIFIRSTPTGTPVKRKQTDAKRVIYAFDRREGSIRTGLELLERGRFEDAGDNFAQAAASGATDSEKVWGAWYEGGAWEAAKRYEDSAKAFAKITTAFKAHRLWLDARYREGFALALARKQAEADAVADDLAAIGRDKGSIAADARAAGVRSANWASQGNRSKLKEFYAKVTFRQSDEPDLWLHFNLWYADTLRGMGDGKSAANIYERVINGGAIDPVRKAQAVLGSGLCLIDSDRQGALVQLLKLDLLPFGSPDQKCEARYQAGRLLWEDSQAARKLPAASTEPGGGFAGELENTARLLLTCASESVEASSANPAKEQARSLLAMLPPIEPEAPAASATGAAPAAPQAPQGPGPAGGASPMGKPPAGKQRAAP